MMTFEDFEFQDWATLVIEISMKGFKSQKIWKVLLEKDRGDYLFKDFLYGYVFDFIDDAHSAKWFSSIDERYGIYLRTSPNGRRLSANETLQDLVDEKMYKEIFTTMKDARVLEYLRMPEPLFQSLERRLG